MPASEKTETDYYMDAIARLDIDTREWVIRQLVAKTTSIKMDAILAEAAKPE